MGFFDFNVGIGRAARPGLGCLDTVPMLLEEMDRFDIDAALVYHMGASEGDMIDGNDRLLELIADEPRLHACWVVAPAFFEDLPSPGKWVSEARAKGVRAFRLFPRYHLYSLDNARVSQFFTHLAVNNMPILIDFGPRHWSEQSIPWPTIVRLAKEHASLNIVVVGATVGDVRELSAALDATENIYVDLHALIPPEFIAQAARAGHHERLLFGTGLPRRAPECIVTQMRKSDCAASALLEVTAENAMRLLGLSTSKAKQISPLAHPDFDVIDVHGHCGSWERTTSPVKTSASFVASMDRCGIAKLVVSSFTAIHGETPTGNAETAAWVSTAPGRLYGYCVINPNYPAETQDELRRCFDEARGFVGFKFHCELHGAQLHDDGYAEALAYANDHRLPVLVHGGGEDRWEEVSERYPDATFIVAHACAWNGYDRAQRAHFARFRDLRNVVVDVSGSPAYRGAMEQLVELLGPDKILYGSDFPMFDLGFEVGRIVMSSLDSATQRAICRDNALRYFRFED